MKTKAPKTPQELINFIKVTFTLARWTFGLRAMDSDTIEGGFEYILLKRQPDGSIQHHKIHEEDLVNPIPDKLSMDDARSFFLAKVLTLGVADYILAVGECGLYIGEDDKIDEFKELVEVFGPNHKSVKKYSQRCCSFSVYDLSGIVMRAMATETNCINAILSTTPQPHEIKKFCEGVFDNENQIGRLVAQLMGKYSSKFTDLSDDCWVLEDDPSDEASGPIEHWGEVVTEALWDMGLGDPSNFQ